MSMGSYDETEIDSGARFAFGENWSKFLENLTDDQIGRAEQSLCTMLKVKTLAGFRFLDIGSGSGLFSLAARRLGGIVYSFDCDKQSVACTYELKSRYYPDDPHWHIDHASVLDKNYLAALGRFDVVYSWGVLHHTGSMYSAVSNAMSAVASNGQLYIAIYNDQGLASRYWLLVKRAYNKNSLLKYILISLHMPYLFAMRWLIRAMTGRLTLERGMALWRDMIDWLGGYPFEVAKPEQIIRYIHREGFALEDLKTCGGRMGCNEYIFRRQT